MIRELMQAVRSLARRPGFTLVAVLTLGLGMGSVVAIFTLVNGILLSPLAYPEADRMVTIDHHAPAIDLPNLGSSSGTMAVYREFADVFSSLAAVTETNRVLTGIDEAAQLELLAVEPAFFDVFATTPALGRPFSATDADEGAAPVLVLLHDAWRSRFGADPGILGTTVQLDGVTTEIVGVMPEDFRLPEPGPAGLVPITRQEPVFGTFGLTAVARLAPGVTVERAAAQVEALQSRVPELFPDLTLEQMEGFGWGVSVTELKEDLVDDVATVLWVVLGTVGFVLLIACANVANLFLVRAEDRQKEVAVRAAMGAGRGQVARTFLAESLVLGLAGGLVGIGVAATGVEALLAWGPGDVPRLSEVALTPLVLVFAGLLALGTGVVLGFLPMTRYTPRAFASVLRDGGRGSTAGRGRSRARSLLVMSQLGLAMVLLVGSGLMFRSFRAMRGVELGFETRDRLTVGLRVGDGLSRDEAGRFYEELRQRVAAMPGVVSAGVTTQVPMAPGGVNGGSFDIQSRPRDENAPPPVAMYRAVSPDYFETMGIELVAGRPMTAADLGGSVAYAWVDEYFAENFLDGDAVGERISWQGNPDEAEGVPEGAGTAPGWIEIAGVVRDLRYRSVREDPSANAFLPMLMDGIDYPGLQTATLAVQVAPGQDPTDLTPAIRREISGLNGQVPVTRVQTVEEIVSRAMAGESVTLVLLGIAAGMALFLGSIGLFGVISYVVRQRTREIGVRIALGAQATQVRRMVLRQGLVVAFGGVVVGLAGATALTRFLESILFEVSSLDPVTFAAAPALLVAVSLLATWLPARRASRVDPMESLREE